jgi:curved DNA-binding protein CbpA
MSDRTLYDLLGVSADAAPECIRAAYLELSSRLNPDSTAHRGNPDVRMQHAAVKEAYGILIHSERRRKYDESLRLRRLQARAASMHTAGYLPRALFLAIVALAGGVYYYHAAVKEALVAAEAEEAAARVREAEAAGAAQAERERVQHEREEQHVVLETAIQAVRRDGRRGLSKAAAGAPSAH